MIPTNYDDGFFVYADFNFSNQESRILDFSWRAPQESVDRFKTLWDLIFRKSFFTSTMLKLMIFSYSGP